jgi:hypothetical protein
MASRRPAPSGKRTVTSVKPPATADARPSSGGTTRRPPPRKPTKGGKRRSRGWLWVLAVVVVVAGVVVGVTLASGGGSSAQTGPEGVPVVKAADLAPSGATGQTVDGIACGSSEQLAYHIHVHLAIFVNGQPAAVPYGVGIQNPSTQQASGAPFVSGGTCYYWLHTHAADGILHIESPKEQLYTLQNFFDVWQQPLSADQVGPAKGHVTVYVNGKQSNQDPRLIPLDAHTQIQLDVGTPVVPPKSISFAKL